MPRTFGGGRAGQGIVAGKAIFHELASDQGEWITGRKTLVEEDSAPSPRVVATEVDATAVLLKIFFGRKVEDFSMAMKDYRDCIIVCLINDYRF